MGSVMNNALNPQILAVHVGTHAATVTIPAGYFAKKSRIKAVRYIDQAGVAADNTNFLQLALQTLAGVEQAELDTRAAHEGALTAMTPKALNLTTADSRTLEIDVPAGTTLKLVATKNGTGVPTLGQLIIEHYPL